MQINIPNISTEVFIVKTSKFIYFNSDQTFFLIITLEKVYVNIALWVLYVKRSNEIRKIGVTEITPNALKILAFSKCFLVFR